MEHRALQEQNGPYKLQRTDKNYSNINEKGAH